MGKLHKLIERIPGNAVVNRIKFCPSVL